jgi:O-acetylhomoserine (thiol)-lyase
LDKKIQTTRKIVEYLESRDEVEFVRYPYASGSKFKELADRDFPLGPGALLSFGFKGTREQEGEFIKALNNFSYHVNIGDVRSLITNPPENTHTELEADQLELADVPKNLIRLSIGLEDAEDLISDLTQAFEKAFA